MKTRAELQNIIEKTAQDAIDKIASPEFFEECGPELGNRLKLAAIWLYCDGANEMMTLLAQIQLDHQNDADEKKAMWIEEEKRWRDWQDKQLAKMLKGG